jgi:methionyl-tRNA synthetase
VLGLWKALEHRGAIYKGNHAGWYCVSEEMFYPENRIRSEQCPKTGIIQRVSSDEGKPVEWVEESNYKFRLSEYLGQVSEWLHRANPVQPRSRLNDLQEIIKDGLPDLSVSRSRASNPWGIPVPNDPDQTIYVWLDALSNYITDATLAGIPDVHVIGKDILKFHAVYWPAFLMAAGLPLPKIILAHGHWSLGRTKMSKSIGNVVDPLYLIDEFGQDAFRYLLLRLSRVDADSEYEPTLFQRRYNIELANTLGNLLSRLANPLFYATKKIFTFDGLDSEFKSDLDQLTREVGSAYDENKFYLGIEHVNGFLTSINAKVNETKPWEAVRDGRSSDLETLMPALLFGTCTAVSLLAPIMPRFCSIFLSALKFKIGKSVDVSDYYAALPSLQFPRLKIN